MQSTRSFMRVLVPTNLLLDVDDLLVKICQQFRNGDFRSDRPRTSDYAQKIRAPSTEITQLSEILQREFQIKESSPEIDRSSQRTQQEHQFIEQPPLIPYLFDAYNTTPTTPFHISNLFKPEDGLGGFFHGTCFIVWVEKGMNGSAKWTDGRSTTTLENNTILKCDRGTVYFKTEKTDAGVGGVYLALVNRISGSGEKK